MNEDNGARRPANAAQAAGHAERRMRSRLPQHTLPNVMQAGVITLAASTCSANCQRWLRIAHCLLRGPNVVDIRARSMRSRMLHLLPDNSLPCSRYRSHMHIQT